MFQAHFDKTEFEHNQTDKPLRWSAIPRMYEEWTKDISSSLEDLKGELLSRNCHNGAFTHFK